MPDEATPQGVSKRERDMEQLIKSRMGSTDDTTDDTQIEDDPGVEDEPVVEMMSFIGADGTEYQVPKDSRARLKVDGEDIEAPLTTALQRYQKGAAGDKRLQEASLAKRELDQRQQELDRREQEFLNKVNAGPSSDDRETDLDRLTNALIEADSEEAKEVLGKMMKPGLPDFDAVIDQKIGQKEADRKRQEYQAKLIDAKASFEDKYSDLAEDPFLFGLVDQETAKISSEKPFADPWEIIEEASNRIRTWSEGKVKSQRRKTAPTPASGRARIGKDEKTFSRSDVINEMKAARGQPVL